MYAYYLTFESQAPWDHTDQQLLRLLPPERAAKCLRYRFDRDKKLCLYSWLLLQFGLFQVTQLPAQQVRFSVGEHGKPYLARPSGLQFNLSHAGSAVVCAISQQGAIGVDVERVCNPPFSIMSTCFHPAEIDFVYATPPEKQPLAFFRIWTGKEACLKKVGTGISHHMRSLNTLNPNIAQHLIQWRHQDYLYTIDAEDVKNPSIEQIQFPTLMEYVRVSAPGYPKTGRSGNV